MKKLLFVYLAGYLVLYLISTGAHAEQNYYYTHAGSYITGACGGTTQKYISSDAACAGANACAGPNAPLHSGVPGWDTGGDASATCVGSLVACKNKNGTQMGSAVASKKICCPAGQTFDGIRCHAQCTPPQVWSAVGNTCIDPEPPPDCEEGETPNPWSGDCEYCPHEQWAGVAMPTYGLALHQCLPNPLDCAQPDSPSGGMGVRDDSANIVDASGAPSSHPGIVKCIAAPPGGCTNVTGKLKFNEFDYCQERKAQCDAIGGTYGAIGDASGVMHMCMKGVGDDLPTCTSGSQYWYEDDFGSAVACVPTKPPSNVCDGQKYDCDDDGNVDDQDKDGCKDNGTLNDFDSCTPRGDPGAPTDPHDPGTPNVGENPLDPAEEGAGDCDPTASNYAECAGLDGGLGEIMKDLKDGKSKPTGGIMGATPNEAVSSFMSGLNDVPVIAAVNGISGVFSGAAECPAPSFSMFGATYAMNYHCTLYESMAGILSAVMHIIFTITAIRIFMSA